MLRSPLESQSFHQKKNEIEKFSFKLDLKSGILDKVEPERIPEKS
jgi:hypothetical protein